MLISPRPSFSRASIFVTGATGFIGSHFVLEWLNQNMGPVKALVRSTFLLDKDERLVQALKTAQTANGAPCLPALEDLETLEGDVTQSACGLVPATIARLRDGNMEVFWHFASDLRHEAHHQKVLQHTNIEGAMNAAALAAALGAKRFVYVSTAYVCGRTEGIIEEELPAADTKFNNAYEESKAQAEHGLVELCQTLGLRLTILRPSIVIGPRSTQSAEGSQTGLLGILHAVSWITSSQAGRSARLRVTACPDAEINFIPVDCVVTDMIGLATTGFGDQRVRHLTAVSSITVAQCWRAISEATGMRNLVLAAPGSFEPTQMELMIARRVAFFLGYITVSHAFQRSLPSAWRVDEADFRGYVREGLAWLAGGNGDEVSLPRQDR